MRTSLIQDLIKGKQTPIHIPYDIEESFEIWKEKINKKEIEPLEIFYAGYVLSNPIIREELKKEKRMQERQEKK